MEIITTHINADFDTIASIIAAKKLYPDAVVVFPGGMEKSVRSFMKQSLFKLAHTKVNKVDLGKVARLILVDTRQRGRIGKVADIVDKPGLEIHIYDHHTKTPTDIKGSVEFISSLGSTTTIMTNILKKKKIAISPEEATVMMIGIYEDTGFLSFISTTGEDYLAAAYLLGKGADLRKVSSTIKRELTADEISLLNDLNEGAERHDINGEDIIIAKASSEDFIEDASLLVHKMTRLSSSDALFALIRMESKIYLIARSNAKEVDAGDITAAMGGGGHPTAASATIKDMTLIEAEEELLRILRGKIKRIGCAGDIMSSHVKNIQPEKSLEKAKEIMTKLNLNILPVVDKGKLVGLISRQDLGKALYHGIKKGRVREFMISDFSVVHINDPLSKIQDIIIGENQKFLPVMKKGELAGCITRTDLLRVLHYEMEKGFEPATREKHIKNMKGAIKGRLPNWLQDIFEKAGSIADEKGVSAYLVGGFVRDLVLARENLDIDMVVEGEGIAFAAELSRALKGRMKSHQKFGTAIIVMPDGFKIDVATARMEYYKEPAALPTVVAGPIKMDLSRRDFTINSMAIKLNHKNFGELTDYFGGLTDIKGKAIRVLHNLSFIEDPTRAFRAVRLEQRFSFKIGNQSLSLMKNASRLDFFDKVSPSRIFNELKSILMEEHPLKSLKRMEALNILRFFHPKFKVTAAIETHFNELRKVTDWYDLLFMDERYNRWLLLLSILMTPLDLKETKKMLKAIGLAAKYRDSIIEIKSIRVGTLKKLKDSKTDDVDLYRTLVGLKLETLMLIMSIDSDKKIRARTSKFITELKWTKSKLSGLDIKNLGIKPGPLFREIKDTLVEERIRGNLETREDEIKLIQKRWPKSLDS